MQNASSGRKGPPYDTCVPREHPRTHTISMYNFKYTKLIGDSTKVPELG